MRGGEAGFQCSLSATRNCLGAWLQYLNKQQRALGRLPDEYYLPCWDVYYKGVSQSILIREIVQVGVGVGVSKKLVSNQVSNTYRGRQECASHGDKTILQTKMRMQVIPYRYEIV